MPSLSMANRENASSDTMGSIGGLHEDADDIDTTALPTSIVISSMHDDHDERTYVHVHVHDAGATLTKLS